MKVQSLADILAAPLSTDDLSSKYRNLESAAFLSKFEDAWRRFLQTMPPDKLPRGKREERIESLLSKIEEIEKSKEVVERELKEQLTFFQQSRLKMEERFDHKVREVMQEQRFIHQKLSQQLRFTNVAAKLQKETLPWFHYLEEINTLAALEEEAEKQEAAKNKKQNRNGDENDNSEEDGQHSRSVKPSSRAMLIINDASIDASNDVDDAYLRAYRVDNAILATHIKVLRKEIERMENMALAHEHVGGFLTENNVWEVMKKAQDEDDSGGQRLVATYTI